MKKQGRRAVRERERSTRGKGHRRYFTEVLEPRLVLSGAHDAALLAAIDNALLATNPSGVASFATRLKDASATGRTLPLTGAGFGTSYDGGAALKSVLNRLAPSYASLAALSSGLEGGAGIGDGINVQATRDNADDLELDVHFLTTTSHTVPVAGTYGINLSVGGNVTLSTVLDFTLTVGAYWDAGTSSGVFYVVDTNDVLKISTSVASTSLNATGALGVVDLTVTGGSAVFTPAFGFSLIDQSTPGQPGRMTLAQLNSVAVPSLVATTLTQGNPTSLTVNFNAALAPTAHNLTVSWADITKPTVATSTLNTDPTLSQLAAFQSIQPTTYSVGLDALVQTISDGTTSALATPNPFLATLPLLGKTTGDVLNVKQLLTNTLLSKTDYTTDAQNQLVLKFTTAGQLLNVLRAIPGVGVANATMTATAGDIRFTLSMPAGAVQNLPMALGIDAQLNLPVTGTMSVTTSTTTNVTFGVDANNNFFILDPGTPLLNATLSATAAINGASKLGFLGVTITSGTASVTGSAALALKDPQTDSPATPGVVSTNEMVAANLNAMAVPTVTGTAAASLPLTSNLSALSGVSGTLGVSWADVKQAQTFTLNTAAVTQFVGFNNITPAVAVNGLSALPAVLNRAGDATALGSNLAFLGSSVGGGVSLGASFQTMVNALGTITTAQDLQGTLNAYFGAANVTVSVTAGDVQFAVAQSQTIPGSLKWSINVTEPTSSQGFQSTGTVAATGTYTSNILFGLGFGAALSATDRFYVITGAGSKVAASFKVAASGTVSAPATIGYLPVNISGGTAMVGATANIANNATITVPFTVPGGGTQLTLTKLQTNAPATELGAPTSDGKVQLTLPITGLPAPQGGGTPQIAVSWANMTVASSPVVTSQFLGDLSGASSYNPASATAGIQSVINMINGWSNIPLFNTNVPLVGTPLKQVWDFVSKGTSFFQAVLSAGVSTASAFNTAVQNAIASAGLDAAQVSLTPQPDNNPSNAVFHYLLNFHYNTTGISKPFNFGSSLFTVNGSVTVGVQFNANIEFGLDKSGGFYLVDRSGAASPEVSLTTGVTAAFDKIGGTFGPVDYGISNGTASVAFNLGLDLVSPGGAGGKIGPGDLANNLTGVARPAFLAGSGGTLDLPIGFYLGSGGPGVATEFKANWNPTNPGAFYFGTGNSTNPVDGFGPVQFELGDFVNGIIGPVLQNIEQYNPLPQKLIDLLNYQLPLINKTPAEILGNVAGQPGFTTLFKIGSLVSQLSSLTGGGTLNLSNYLTGAPNTGTPPSVAGSGGTAAEQSPFTSYLSSLRTNYSFSLPVLDNPASSIVSVLLGQNVKLVEFNPGHLEISKTLTSPKIVIPLFSLGVVDAAVTAQIGGSVGFFANVDFGIDSSGLTGNNIPHEKNLLDGIFIGDTDRFQVGFEGTVFLDLGGQASVFGIPVVQVYGRLGLALDLGLHVNDVRYTTPTGHTPVTSPGTAEVNYGETGGNGYTTLDELNYLFSNYGPLCTLAFGGTLSLFGGVGFRGPDIPFIGPVPDIYKQLGTVVLIDFNLPCDPPPPVTLANIVGNSLVMVPDASTNGRHIDLSVYYDDQNNPKGVTISKFDANSPTTAAQHQEFDFATLAAAGVTNLVVEGTNGDDLIQIAPILTSAYNFQHVTVNTHNGNDEVKWGSINQTTSHLLGTTITAGDGNDTLTGTYRPDSIVAGNGNDTVQGLDGNDTIQTGNGNSTVQGGDGNDFITVGGGQNKVALGGGNSTVFVGNGGNQITGGNGNNTVHGGGGGDKYYLGDGANSVLAGSGNDVIYVGQGANWVSTGNGNDFVSAGNGNNTVYGGIGNDQITAGNGNNNVYGVGNNTIKAGDGKNYVSAGPGNNIVTLGNGDNKVLAGNGANYVSTGRGQDIIQLGTGPDTVLSSAGDDSVSVGTGNDFVDGGAGTNLLQVQGDVNFALANSAITTSAGTVNYFNIQRLTLTGGGGNNTFDVSAYTLPLPVILDGNGGTDTLVSTNDLNFVLGDGSFTRSDNTAFTLKNIARAQLTGGVSDNSFDVGAFTGPVTVEGGTAPADYNRIIDTVPGTYTLTNASLTRSTGGLVTLSHVNRATLPGGTSVVNSAGFTGLVDLTGGGTPPTTVPTSSDSFGRWTELGQSASNGGISASPATAIEPSIAASATGQFVAWADNRGGSYQIFVAQHTAAGWTQLAGSAQGGGISSAAGNARRPAIALDASGNPIVAWTVFNGASTDIQVASYSPTANGGAGGWVALGTSLGAGGISGTGVADNAEIVNTSAGAVVAWLDRSSGAANVYVKQFAGGVWSALGAGAAGGTGVSASASAVPEFSLATDGTKVAVAWTQPLGGPTQVYLKQYSGGAWAAVNGSASGNGVSGGGADSAAQPSVAYLGGVIFVAYQASVGGQLNAAAVVTSGAGWAAVAVDTPASAGNAVTRGAASQPQLFQSGGTLELVWVERRLAGTPSQDTEIYATRYNGASFARVLPGDASYHGIYWTSTSVSSLALSVDPAGRPFVAWGDNASGSPEIYALGATFAIHNVYYVNDGLTLDDSYTTAAGSNANTGTTASSPLDSVQSVVGKYALTAGDVILVDSGSYGGFSLSGSPSGILVMGSGGVPSTFVGAVTLTNAQGVILQALNLSGGLTVNSGTNVQLSNLAVSNLTMTGGTGNRLEHGALSTLTLGGGLNNAVVVNNVVAGQVALATGGTTNLTMSGNRIGGGLAINAASSGTITNNDISAGGTVVSLAAAFTGSVDHNAIHGGSVGVSYGASTPLNANRIYGNGTGVVATVNSNTTGLGFVAGSVANDIYFNTTGVNLTGLMQLQHVFSNGTGVIGSGTLGGGTLDSANLIEMNATGVNFTGTIQFNRIARNTIGIQAKSGNVIVHNLIYRNVNAGIVTGGTSDVRVWNNTFYATGGNNLQVDGGSGNVQALNNVFWTAGGYDVFVADDSRTGFFSDYNDLYSTGTGKLVHWLLDFTDVLDWQVNVNRFDLHSIGTTAVNPTWAQPQFVNLSRDDFHVLGITGALRASSPTIDTGAPMSDVGLPASYVNLLANPSFESGTTSWSVSVGATTQGSNPPAFAGSNYFYSGGVASGFAQQTVNLLGSGFTAANLDNQSLVAVFGGRVRSAANETPADQGRLIVTFLDGSSTAIGAADTVPATNAGDRWELIGDRLHIPAGTRSITYRFEALRQTGSTDDSYLDGAFLYVIPTTTAPDQGAYGNTASDLDLATPHIHLVWPDLYTDWELSTPHNIQWSTFGSGGSQVSLDLYQDNAGVPQFLMHIATVADTGSYAWIPASPLTYGTYGLRIQASLVSNPAILDRGSETFTIPENGHSFYLNDASQAGDVYASAVGNNRNTGKLPGKPKPLLTSLLRVYNLGGADTVYVDTGTYYHFDPIVISGNPAVGGDQGVTITGPANPANVAQINTLGFTSPAVFDVNNGNFAILSHLSIVGGDYGVWVRNTSSNVQATYLTISGATFDGIRLEGNSTVGGVLDHVTSFNNGRDGISVGGTGVNLTNSVAHHNAAGAGVRYDNSGGVVLTANQSYANKYGFYVVNSTGTPATIGNANLALNLGNVAHDNAVYGVYASGAIAVAGNTVYDTGGPGGAGPAALTGSAAAGQYLNPGATYYYRVTALTAAGETISSPERAVSGNTGVSLSWSAVPGATSYNVYRGNSPSNEYLVTNTGGTGFLDNGSLGSGTALSATASVGVDLYNGATAAANVVSTSYLGIYTSGGAVANNRVFNSAGSGIYASNANATGNVLYSNAVGLEGDNSPTWANNLIYANGIAGIWLHNGFSANIFNNTIYQPLGDGIRVESSGGNFSFQHVNVRNNLVWVQAGYGITVTPQAEIGFQSDYNDWYVTSAGKVGYWENVARPTLTAWKLSAFTDANSISADPMFVNPSGADGQMGFAGFADRGTDDDFHEKSVAGSFHGGALAPAVNAGTGLPAPVTGTLTADAASSPLVDRGDPSSAFANEPSPNGGFVNMGAFGNSVQASETYIPYVLVLAPNGGEALVEGQTYAITWRSEVATGTATIDLMNGATVVANVATGVANNGSYNWTIPTSIAPGNYTVRVTRNSTPVSSDVSDASFTLSGPTHAFYVNDATVAAGDFTTAPGSDANSGLDPAHPMASIRALLNAYNLSAGDVVYVDVGTYLLSSNVVIPANRSGVTIRGFYDAGNPARVSVINRTSTAAGAVTFDVQATNVTLDRLSITGGDVGVNLSDGANATGFTLSNCDVYGNWDLDVYVGSINANATITGNKIHDTSGQYAVTNTGVSTRSVQVTITNNVIYNNARNGLDVQNGNNSTISGNTVYSNGTGISADTSTISGNIAYNNANAGIIASGNSVVTGNTTYNNSGTNATPQAGIWAYAGTVSGNVSYGNSYGIYLSGNVTVSNNRLYGNTLDGVYAGGSSTVSGNVIYQNGVGIEGDNSPQYLNNVVYGNTTAGIWLHGGVAPLIANNTVYQTTGDGIRLESTNFNLQFQHMKLRNNVVWAQGGYDITATPNSIYGFDSDANDLYVTGTAQIASWAGTALSNLANWQQVAIQDANSISADPLFVSAAAADFHEQSLYGSFHGGSLAPVLNVATGLPQAVTSTLTNDANQAPGIDRGDPASPYANEPSPNGGFVNLGAFGNTAQASKSPTTYMLVTKPGGGETWIEGQSFTIKWRDHNVGTGLVNIDLMVQNGGAPVLQSSIISGAPNSGQFVWTPATSIPAGSSYFIRVTEQGGPSALSLAPFSIAAATHVYYVNDGSVQAGDWTTAPGDDLNNSGLDAAHPKATIAAIFNAYTLTSPDTIKIDRGIYNLTGDINVTAAQSGIHIVGFTGADGSAGWNANVTASAPIAYYRFGESSGAAAIDASGNGINGTYTNGSTLGQPGALSGDANTSATFNGTNQYVTLPAGFANFTNGFSYEAWVYPTAATSYSRFIDLATGQGVDNILFYRVGATNDVGFNVSKGTTFGAEVRASGVLEFNKWQHLVVTETAAGAVTIYKNGIVVGTGTTSVPNNVTRTLNYLGKSQYPADGYYAGGMDEAAIYNRALTPSEVAARDSLVATQAIINRGSTGATVFNFQAGANNVTLDSLAMTGAGTAVYANYGVGALSDTVVNCEFYGIRDNGIFLGSGNNGWTITNNRFHDINGGYGSGSTGVNINGSSNTTITGNLVYNNPRTGINLTGGTGGTVANNTVYANGTGIYADNATISNNLSHDNSSYGIAVGGGGLAVNNTVYNSLGTNNYGIWLYAGEARSNTVYNNTNGIGTGGALIDYNRVFHNTGDGIYAGSSTTVTGNVVYSNNIGIEGSNASNNAARGPWFYNNLSYANAAAGIWVHGGADSQFLNNTVYQPAGDALKIDGGSVNIVIRNNILYSAGGYVLTVTDDSASNFQSDYNDLYAAGTAKVGKWSSVDFPTYASWLYEWGLDAHSVSADPLFVGPVGADGGLGYVGGVDRGGDDNFHLQPASPAIDAGNPASLFLNEPAPNGARINLGHLGNTAQADATPAAQTVQVTAPGNLQKLEAGHPYTFTWQTFGVAANQPVLLMDAGGPAVGLWAADAFSIVGMNTRTVGNVIDTSGVSNPAPQQVYQSYAWASPQLSYKLPVPDGAYTIRLHFMDDVNYVGKSVMNVKVNGTPVRTGYDLFADAGAGYKATALSFNVNATGGNGLLVELVATSGYAVLSGIELSAPNAAPVPSPTANLQVSTNGGAAWTTIATNQPLDNLGRGSYVWTPSTTTAGPTALFRVLINGTALSGTSKPFAVYGGGADYYVNDSSTAGDSITTAVGNNANSGKSPDSPLADIQAVLSQYNPGAGAVIHVDAGTYVLVHDLLLQTANNGLTIQGPANAAAVVNRANVGASVFAFANGASSITLDHLSITGASWGVYAYYGTNNANITVSNSLVYGNDNGGIFWGSTNPGWVVTGNTVHDNGTGYARSNKGIDDEGNAATIANNTVYNEINFGIVVANGQGTTVDGNEVYANGSGISASNASVSNNRVHDNASGGIGIDSGSVALGNTVYRQTAANAYGMFVSNAEARGNAVYGNFNGIAGSGANVTIDRNRVYSNTNFGVTVSNANGSIFDNVVYANSAAGIVVSGSSGEVVVHNTVYQLAGDAVRLTGSPNARVRGNILWVEAGYDLNVSADSQSGLISDFNELYRGPGASAHVGFWAGAAQDQIAAWRTASGQDAGSVAADPGFVNVKGADQVLGYNPAGVGYDGGQDDNFYLTPASPAIDHGYSWGPVSDILGQGRVDTPGTANAGSPDYVAAVQASSLYALTGTAQVWRASNAYWNYTLPFAFPFYDGTYTTNVQVSSSGLIQFAGSDYAGNPANSDAGLLPDRRVAALWDNLSTSFAGNDIYVDTLVAGQVKFTWKATNVADGSAVNFSIVLFSNGQIRFDYGAGNTNLTPTVGLSMGDSTHYALASYDNAATLTNANSVLWTLPPGFADMGAYEFRGSAADVTPPTISGTTPAAIQAQGTGAPVSQIGLTFSEPLNAVDAGAAANYQLVWAGPNGTFGNADDVTYSLTPLYTAGSSQVTLVQSGGGTLPSGVYRLTVSGSAPAGIHDLSGNLLDGDTNGSAGGDYVRQFTLGYPAANVINGTGLVDQITLTQDADHVHVDWTMGTAGGQLLIGDAAGLTINGAGANDVITLNYANGNPLPGMLHLNGTFTVNGLAGTNPLAGGTLEIGKSTVYIAYAGPASDPIANIRSYLGNGYNGGAWTGAPTAGTGVITSANAASNPLHNSAIGYIDAGDGTGLNPVANTILLKYAVVGDTDLDGTVGLSDYTAVVRNFGVGMNWDQGVVTYGAVVGLSDYTAVVRNFGQNTPAAAPAAAPATTTAVSTNTMVGPAPAPAPAPARVATAPAAPASPSTAGASGSSHDDASHSSPHGASHRRRAARRR